LTAFGLAAVPAAGGGGGGPASPQDKTTSAPSSPCRSAREPRLLDLAAAGAVYAGLLYGFFALSDPDLPVRAESQPVTFLLVQLLDDGLLTAIALAFGRWRFPGSLKDLGLRWVSPRWWALGLAGGAGAAGLALGVALALEWGGWPPPAHPVETILAAVESRWDAGVILVAVTVPVAIGEETFFRGFAYRLLRARFGLGVALGATTVIFALVHGLEPGAWLPVLPVGLIFGVLVERSQSLVPAMIGHGVVNAVAVLAG
jgi:membrane protease YdiL (CAAX protease family)